MALKTIHFRPIDLVSLFAREFPICILYTPRKSKQNFVIIHMCFIRYKTTATVVISFVFAHELLMSVLIALSSALYHANLNSRTCLVCARPSS